MSFATVSTNQMELTPMRVTFDGVDLGGTLENVVVSVEISKAEIKADQSGETVRDRRVSGQVFKVTTTLTQVKNKDQWKVAFPSMNKVVSGLNKAIYVDAKIGASDQAAAKQLILHPLSLPDADKSGDYLFYKAIAAETSEITYGPTEQAGLQVEWTILPDDSVQPERFFFHGDPTIGLVAASAGAAVAGANTGNGTVGTISVNNAFTKTETITLTCVNAAVNSGLFQVSGSISGPLGNATVGVGFSSNPIAFLISDGSTDFIVGDSFTIATVASNYA